LEAHLFASGLQIGGFADNTLKYRIVGMKNNITKIDGTS